MVERLHQLHVEFGGFNVAVAVVNTQSFSATENVGRRELRRKRAIVLSDLGANSAGDPRKLFAIEGNDVAVG